MKIYLAGSTVNQEYLRVIKQRLVMLDHEVSSTWLQSAYQYSDKRCAPEHLRAEAPRDFEEIAQCDLFILDRAGKSFGKDVEMGGALLQGKPVWLVRKSDGPCIFYSLCPKFCSVFGELGDETARLEARMARRENEEARKRRRAS